MMLHMRISADDVAALAIIAGLLGVWLTARYQRGLASELYRQFRQNASADRRRAAYEDFMLAAGRLVWLLTTTEPGDAPSEKLRADVLAAVDDTARVFVVVRFAGSPEQACQAAANVVDHARRILKALTPEPGSPEGSALQDLARDYEATLDKFTGIARAEYS
jgi:hypothetical protein